MKKTLLLCLALIIALGTVGVGYALWSENLYIEGSAYTGEVDASWSVEACGNKDDCRDNLNRDSSSVTSALNICDTRCANITCEISPDGYTLFVTITNAYPCDEFFVIFDIHCTGTVPIHVGEFIVNQESALNNISDNSLLCPPPQCEPFSVDVEYCGPWQLHPCEEGYGRIDIKLNKCIEPCTTYTFSIEVEVGQYNEFPIGGSL